jgi:hypothetical protein
VTLETRCPGHTLPPVLPPPQAQMIAVGGLKAGRLLAALVKPAAAGAASSASPDVVHVVFSICPFPD